MWVEERHRTRRHIESHHVGAYEEVRNARMSVFCHHAYHHCNLTMMTSLDQQPNQSEIRMFFKTLCNTTKSVSAKDILKHTKFKREIILRTLKILNIT